MSSPPFSINEAIPADADIVAQHPANARAFREVVESYLNFEHDATTGRHKFPTDTTANLGALTFPSSGSFSYDTTLDVLRYKLASGHKVIDFPQGTRAVFQQTNAPPGWTKETDAAFNNATFQIFTGAVSNGGSTAFGTVFAARTIAQANLPNVNFTVTGSTDQHNGHTHSIGSDGNHQHFLFEDTEIFVDGTNIDSTHAAVRFRGDGTGSGNYTIKHDGGTDPATVGLSSVAGSHNHAGGTGSSGVHNHTVTGNAASGGSGTALDFAVKFIGVIVAAKA